MTTGRPSSSFARIVPRPQATRSAAQYALASVRTPITDGHPAGRAFGVEGRAPLYSLPPRANPSIFPPPFTSPLGYFGGGSGLGSLFDPSPSRGSHGSSGIHDSYDSGNNLASSVSEEGEEELDELKKLIEKKEEFEKKIEAKSKQQAKLHNEDEDWWKLDDEIKELEDAKNELDDTIKAAVEEIKKSSKAENGEELSTEEIIERIKNGEYQDLLENLNKLSPEERKKLRELIEAGGRTINKYHNLFEIEPERTHNMSNTAFAALSSSAPSERRSTNSLDPDDIFPA